MGRTANKLYTSMLKCRDRNVSSYVPTKSITVNTKTKGVLVAAPRTSKLPCYRCRRPRSEPKSARTAGPGPAHSSSTVEEQARGHGPRAPSRAPVSESGLELRSAAPLALLLQVLRSHLPPPGASACFTRMQYALSYSPTPSAAATRCHCSSTRACN